MVKSRLDDSVNYIETKLLSDDDRMMDTMLYEITILGKPIEIAIGNIKTTFVSKNIQYFPIYLIKNDRVKSQIGVYEIRSNKALDIFDDDGDVDVSLLGEPLIYSFVLDNTTEILETTPAKLASLKKLSSLKSASLKQESAYSNEETQAEEAEEATEEAQEGNDEIEDYE